MGFVHTTTSSNWLDRLMTDLMRNASTGRATRCRRRDLVAAKMPCWSAHLPRSLPRRVERTRARGRGSGAGTGRCTAALARLHVGPLRRLHADNPVDSIQRNDGGHLHGLVREDVGGEPCVRGRRHHRASRAQRADTRATLDSWTGQRSERLHDGKRERRTLRQICYADRARCRQGRAAN